MKADADRAELQDDGEALGGKARGRGRREEKRKGEEEEERKSREEAEAERKRQGKKRRGRKKKAVEETQTEKAQMSFTDAELHIMQTNNKGWDYCGNAQASVDEAYQSILAGDVTDAPNDKQQAEPMARATLANLAQAGIERPTDELGEPQAIPSTLDNGS